MLYDRPDGGIHACRDPSHTITLNGTPSLVDVGYGLDVKQIKTRMSIYAAPTCSFSLQRACDPASGGCFVAAESIVGPEGADLLFQVSLGIWLLKTQK